jgi:moderate conductance mechanosensitive channel
MRPIACLAVLLVLLAAPAAAQLAPAPAEDAAATEAGPDPAEAARLLADVIEDPEARAALVAQLRDAAGGTAAEDPEQPLDLPVVRDLADRTVALAEDVSDRVLGLARTLGDPGALLASVAAIDWRRLGEEAARLGVIVLATIGAFFLLRLITRSPRTRLATRLQGGPTWLSVLPGLLVLAVIDLAMMLLAWGAGYGLALALAEPGRMDLRQSLFLNAFLLVEVTKLLLRLLLSPRRQALRLVPMGNDTAWEWYVTPARLIALLGYGLLVAVPVARVTVSWRFGEALELVIVLLAAWRAIALILRNRKRAKSALHAQAGEDSVGVVGHALRALAQVWHYLAIAYVVGLVVVWHTRPGESLGFMLSATLQSVAAILLGTVAMVLISRWIKGGVTLSDDTRRRLPLLEGRLNALVPRILSGLRLLLFVAVIAAIAHAWELFDIGDWMASETGAAIVANLLTAAVILLLAAVAWLAVSSWIEVKLNPEGTRLVTARQRTLLSLFRSAFTVLVVVMAGMLALSALGVNIAPLIAGAGVVGLAIGFGAQRMVQDIITGAFIQVENAMNTGDVVTAGGVTGTVEKLTIRSVGLRDLSGTYHLIPFSSVDTVSNFMKDFSYHVADVGVAYRENVDEVKARMQEAFERLLETEHGANVIGPLDMHGLTEFRDSAVLVRARIMTRPGEQWGVGRAYNEILKQTFDGADIQIPFPHLTVYMGQDKAGDAPPLNLRRAAPPDRPVRPPHGPVPASSDVNLPLDAGYGAPEEET